ncbi:MAG: hypothetical protein BGO49_17320 [Planctomycetales bacterium 71-10]|nr:MAG: hypothetical protein BGO49_17320 [Planctomycetales bacterium 71-10]
MSWRGDERDINDEDDAMGLWSRLFGGKGEQGGHEPSSMPWDGRPSILEHVRSHVAIDGPGMAEGGDTLPDEERIAQGSKIRWAAGAMDGVATHHMGTGEDEEAVRKAAELVVAYSRQPTASNKAAVYRHVVAGHVVSIIDPVIEALTNEPLIGHERLYELARSFATDAPDREPVKFGIALLGMFGQPQDRDLFLTLGRHEEFTLFCVVALANSPEDADEALWTLARTVAGWGRIHAVERLALSEDPEIRRWLLREGYWNSVMYEYTAATCARAGGLLTALGDDDVDRGLLTAAGQILQALIAGGPAEGIDDYEDARPVIESFLGRMASSAETVEDFLHVHAIGGYLDEDESLWAGRYDAGWSPEVRERLRSECRSILGRPEWEGRVRVGLESGDELVFAHADQAARALGIDTWDLHRRRLLEKPADPGRWYHVMALCDETRIGEVMAFAEASIGLTTIATGAGDELGLVRPQA